MSYSLASELKKQKNVPCSLVGSTLFFPTIILTMCQSNCSCRADDDEEAQNGEGPRHRHRGWVLQERRDSEEEPRPGSDEPQVRDDPRAVVAGQHYVLW